jgi:hypothetical protein
MVMLQSLQVQAKLFTLLVPFILSKAFYQHFFLILHSLALHPLP